MARWAGTENEDCGLTRALELGWRVAYLYALADDDLGEPLQDTLLPLHGSLQPEDQLDLQVRTAAGDARHAGVERSAQALDELVPTARRARRSEAECAEFRTALRECHVELDKGLWASCEAHAKAYELGNGLSDTYNRICRAYRDPGIDVGEEWQAVFHPQRVSRLKDCLHDLQSRLDPRAVTVVSDQLDVWQVRVSDGSFTTPAVGDVRVLLRRQTIIWRQLLVGDKRPEAFLDRHQRATLGRELTRLAWKRYLPCLPALAVLVGLLLLAVANLSHLAHWYQHNLAATGAATLLASLAGALGLTMASVGFTVRTRMSEWTELLWSRAVAKRVTEVTLCVDDLLTPPTHNTVVQAARRAGQRTGATARRTKRRLHPGKPGTPDTATPA
jgi:hypothetical protein